MNATGRTGYQGRILTAEPSRQPPLVPVLVASAGLRMEKGFRNCFTQKAGFLLVEAAGTPEQLLLQCQRLAPCVLIADLEFVESLEPGDLAALADFGRAARVLVRGPAPDERTVQKLVRLGCAGVIAETEPPAVLRKAVKAVARGEFWVERLSLAHLLQKLLFASHSPRLTPREKEILRLIAQGFKNRGIAEKLSISHETVRWHIRGLHAKLGLQDRLETALYARHYIESDASPDSEEQLHPARQIETSV